MSGIWVPGSLEDSSAPPSGSISYPEDQQNGLLKFSYAPAELHKVT